MLPGATAAEGTTAVNFSVRTRGADHVSLVIMRPPTGMLAAADTGGSSRPDWGVLEVALDPR